MGQHIEVEVIGSVTVAHLRTTALTSLCMDALAGELLALADRRRLWLDFSQVEFLSAAALGMLLRLHATMQAAGGRLTLVHLQPLPAEVFAITGLTRVFNLRPLPRRPTRWRPPDGPALGRPDLLPLASPRPGAGV